MFLWLCALTGLVGFLLSLLLLPRSRPAFLRAGLSGRDQAKADRREVAEAGGVIVGGVFFVVCLASIPTVFLLVSKSANASRDNVDFDTDDFPHALFAQVMSGLLSICCMLLLGFVDDVLDVPWRHKLLLPMPATLPLLIVYYVSSNRTVVVVPLILRPLINLDMVDLGFGYYLYMLMLAIFCTHAINIYAGINGLEVGQVVIVTLSLIVFNIKEIQGHLAEQHTLSLFFLIPFLGTSIALLIYNWYPSKFFPGDTFCYASGMTFAVVGILGHFSKTLLLFFIPQIFNFIYSCPQLFRFVSCPRHRLPQYSAKEDRLRPSLITFKKNSISAPATLMIEVLRRTGLVYYKEEVVKDNQMMVEMNNLTLINLVLVKLGPLHEQTLVILLLLLQTMSSVVAFGIRYPVALWLYGEVVA